MGKIRSNTLERNNTIKKLFIEARELKTDEAEILKDISLKIDLEEFYVKSILMMQGIKFQRKKTYTRINKNVLNTRNQTIIKMYNDGSSVENLSEFFKLSKVRIRQILKDHLIKRVEDNNLESTFNKIKSDFENGIEYKEIVKKYGKNIFYIKKRFGYSLFQEFLKKRTIDILELIKNNSPQFIANKYEININHVYSILHDNGIRLKITEKEKKKRDKNILIDVKNKLKIKDIAKKYKLTQAMIRTIAANNKNENVKK